MNNHYRNVMTRYEREENKVSLKEKGFMYSYGDDCKKKTKKRKKIDGQ
jgi:hypothetical protein